MQNKQQFAYNTTDIRSQKNPGMQQKFGKFPYSLYLVVSACDNLTITGTIMTFLFCFAFQMKYAAVVLARAI